MNQEITARHFSHINFLEVLTTLFIVGVGVLLLFLDFSQNAIIEFLYKLDGVIFIGAGLIGVYGSLYVNKNIPDGNSFCWANGRGPFTLFNNIVLGLLAFLLVFIMIAYEFNAVGGVISFSIGASVLIIDSMYGVFYRNTKCVIVNQDKIIVFSRGKIKELDSRDMALYTNSIRFAGFKLISRDNEILVKWSAYWDGSEQLTKKLDEKHVKYTLKKEL
ncbi:hypothetical protein [Pseudobutyrivibrio ruminis]|uniref:hypothetical protein n=1 Tax=Pseudobutyrivibrio ruminis TaxID=46206 RepID=UPI0003FC4965|nr:hypothetical protein [Pseudobutyrivibrio ruminis]